MKTVIVLLAVLAVSFAETYSTASDWLDIDTLVKDPETLKTLTECFTDVGPCDERAARFRKVLPEAIQTACAKCTPAQKHMLKTYLLEAKKTPAYADALKSKYDPDNIYRVPLREALADF